MARLTLILGVLATVIYLLDGYRFLLNEWRRWRNKGTWLAVLGLCLLPSMAEAAAHYIRVGAVGANDGSTWADAWTDFPTTTTYVRGDEYYVAIGTYTMAINVTTAVSGVTTIKICKATVSTVGSCSTAHGSDTGWSDTYAGQAVMTNPFAIQFSSNYWILDGVVGSGSNPATYGFYYTPDGSATANKPIRITNSFLQFRHIAIACPGPGEDEESFGTEGYGTNVTMSYMYVDNCQVSMFNRGDDNLVENSWFATHWSSAAHHGVHVEQLLRPIFRNNVMTYCAGPCIEAGDGDLTNGAYYNNVFANINSGNGVIKGTSFDSVIDTVVYGNTVINCAGPILYQNNLGLGAGSGNTVVNNLLYNSSPELINEGGAGAIAHSYNSHFDHTAGSPPSETGLQDTTGNPIVDYANGDYHLRYATDGGQALGAPYTTDLYGIVRGGDGTWDRGAAEFSNASSPVVIVRVIRWMEVASIITGLGWHFRKPLMAMCLAGLSLGGTLLQVAPKSYDTLKVVSRDSAVKVLTVFNHLTKPRD
jgi:hypothetical protein